VRTHLSIPDAGLSREFEVDSFQTLFDLIGVLARRRYQAAERSFAVLGLNHTEARLLSLLHQEGGTTGQDVLSGMLNVDRTNAGRGLKRLEEGGYIERRAAEADKRANLVHMTAKGRKTVGEISKLKKAMAQNFFGDLTAKEADTAVALIKKALARDMDEKRA
jgi:DNA-binding MarR family transcriptional regulator